MLCICRIVLNVPTMARLFRQSPCACFQSHCSGLTCRSVCLSYVTCRDPPPPRRRPAPAPLTAGVCCRVRPGVQPDKPDRRRTRLLVRVAPLAGGCRSGHTPGRWVLFGSHPWKVGVVRVTPLAGGCRSGRTPGRWVLFGSHPWQVGVVRVAPLAGGCRSGHTPGRWVSFGSHPWQVDVVRVTPLTGECRSGHTPGRWVSFGSHPWQVGVVRVAPLAGGCRSGRIPGSGLFHKAFYIKFVVCSL